jgi:hypothetical protein
VEFVRHGAPASSAAFTSSAASAASPASEYCHLFLYAKGLLSEETSQWRTLFFRCILRPTCEEKAGDKLARLKRIVDVGQTSPAVHDALEPGELQVFILLA